MKQTDLSYFESAPPPRSDELCKRFASKVDPWWGFVVYAILWAFVSMVSLTLGMVPPLLLAEALGQKEATWAMALSFAGGFVGFTSTWWLFGRWVKRRRAATKPLLRDGELLTGTVVDKFAAPAAEVAKRVVLDFAASQLGGVKFYRVEVEHEGVRRMIHVTPHGFRPAANTQLRVLFHPTAKHALVFDPRGRLQVARTR